MLPTEGADAQETVLFEVYRGWGNRAGQTMSADITRQKVKSRRNWGLEGSELQKLQKHRREGARCR